MPCAVSVVGPYTTSLAAEISRLQRMKHEAAANALSQGWFRLIDALRGEGKPDMVATEAAARIYLLAA